MCLKDRISSPLEAGPSLLNDHHLSPSLTPALEHASSRLAKKSLHLTLVMVRRDYQLPTTAASSPLLCLASTSTSPSPSTSSSSSSVITSSLSRRSFALRPVTALKQLVRTGSCRHGPGTASNHARSNDMSRGSRLKRANSSTEAPGPQVRRPISSIAPLSPPPVTLYTPSSMATMTTATTATTTDHPGPMTSHAPGFLLFHAPDLSPCDQKAQRAIFTRTARKFNLPLLTPAVSPLAYGLSSQLFTNSVIQHQVLFSSDGLTILALDRLYSLKAALASYARIKTPLRLEDAVDELRRYVLAGNGAPVTKSHLFCAYDWLNVGPGAVADLDSMYKRAYGGPDQVGAIAGIEPIARPPAPLPPLRANDEFSAAGSPCHDRQRCLSSSGNGLRICPETDGYALAGHSDGDLELHPDQNHDHDRQHYLSPLMKEPCVRPETDGHLLAGYQDGDLELHPDQDHDRQHYLSPLMQEPRIRPDPDGYALTVYQDEDPELNPDQIGLAITTYSDTRKPAPVSRGPALRVQSDFQSASRPLVLRSKWGYEDEDEDDDDDDEHETSNGTGNGTNNDSCHKYTAVERQGLEMHRTARFQAPAMGFVPWKSRSMSRLRGVGVGVGVGSVTIPEETPMCRGPVTPNGYDDISPITRGEWSFLMVDEPSAKGRTGAVGT